MFRTDDYEKPVMILGIESSCDETAAAIVEDGARVLSNVVASQMSVHGKYDGIVFHAGTTRDPDGVLRTAGGRVLSVTALADTVAAALAALLVTAWPAMKLGSEFMPTLNEGTLFYMPTTLPGLSIEQAARLLQHQDRVLRTFPEVESVFGKAGRADTSTDPAPFSMMETTVVLKPEGQWSPKERWYLPSAEKTTMPRLVSVVT